MLRGRAGKQQVPHRAFSPVRNAELFLFSAGFGMTSLQNARGGERPAVSHSLLLPS